MAKDAATPWFDYHEHPAGRGSDTAVTPHLHVHVQADIRGKTHGKLYLPTGRVASEDLVSMLIRDLQVRPRELPDKKSWPTVLEETRASFTELRQRS